MDDTEYFDMLEAQEQEAAAAYEEMIAEQEAEIAYYEYLESQEGEE